MNHAEWTVFWRESRSGFRRYEVFVKDGIEYVRTPTKELADVVVDDFQTPGLPPVYLKKRSRPFASVAP
jgi:spermidine synthase